MIGSWLIAAMPTGAQPGQPRQLGTDKMFIRHGAWVRTGDNRFDLTFAGIAFDFAGEFLAMRRIRVAIEPSGAQDGFSGPAKSQFIGADGQVLRSSTATVQGTRIQLESLA